MDDKLREMARQAVAEADPDGPGGARMQAVKLLRERDDKRRSMTEYVAAVSWALRQRRAADLPDGSIVASQTVAFLKDHQVPDRPWSCTDGGHAPDEEIDRYLGLNARVLRVGTGED